MSDTFARARSVGVGALGAAMSAMRGGFAETGFEGIARDEAAAAPAEPKHFKPAHPGANPTAGWDPFDPLGEKARAAAAAVPDEPPPAPDPAPDPLALARAEGYADGLAAAERIAAQKLETDRAALDAIAARLAELGALERDSLAARLRQTVLHLVAQMVGETGIAADRLAARVDAATQLLADQSEPASVKLHPDDLALLDGRIPARLTAVADPALERGAFRIETRHGAIEDGPGAWLAQLAAAIERAPVPDPR
jgi:flagellar assembly protein FliH